MAKRFNLGTAVSRFKSVVPLAAIVTAWAVGAPAEGLQAPAAQPEGATSGQSADQTGTECGATETTGLIKAISIVKSRAEVVANGDVDLEGVKVGEGKELDLLRGIDFNVKMEAYFGQPLSDETIKLLQREIIYYYRSKRRPVVDVVIPEQTSTMQGVIQVWVREAKLGNVTVEGAKWSKNSLYKDSITLKPGEPIDMNKVEPDLAWLNQNQGRNVGVAYKPGEAEGEADLVVRVEERFPLRPFVGFENSGPKLAGENRVFAGLNWYNVFGLDHRFNYQYTSDYEFKALWSHTMGYEIPLPWRHTLSFFGGYIESKADLSSALGIAGTTQKGTTYQVGVRYEFPLPKWGEYTQNLAFGFDFKDTDSFLEFGGPAPTGHNPVDVAQFAAVYKSMLPDRWGSTSLRGEGYYSPGGITSLNKDAVFTVQRKGANADYAYGLVTLQRETRLGQGINWNVKLQGQLANGPLLPTEQFGLGGANTVRGFDERLVNGDEAWLASTEVISPGFPLASMIFPGAQDSIQVLGFFDYGHTLHFQPQAGEHFNATLGSVGAGLRYSVRRNLSVRFDYGWGVEDTLKRVLKPAPSESHGHVSAVLSF